MTDHGHFKPYLRPQRASMTHGDGIGLRFPLILGSSKLRAIGSIAECLEINGIDIFDDAFYPGIRANSRSFLYVGGVESWKDDSA